MNITINTLEIQNFKGIVTPIRMEFNSRLTNIYGANHTGKTTTMDAVLWLLFGKNSQGETTFGIDPLDAEGNIIHNLENRVCATFTADGRELTLERKRTEVWKKVRGEMSETYSHTTAFYVDGNKLSEKEYKAFISEQLIHENLFKAITNPAYFPSLPAADQRTLLTKMVGEISHEDIAGGDPSFADLLQQLDTASLDDISRRTAYSIKQIKQELDILPAQISERAAMVAECKERLPEGFDAERAGHHLLAIDEETRQLQEQLHSVSARHDKRFAEVNALKDEATATKLRMEDIRREVENENHQRTLNHETETSDARTKLRTRQAEIRRHEADITQAKTDLTHIEKRKIAIRQEWSEVEGRTFEFTGDEYCHHCGQRLPDDNISQLKAKALALFNSRKQADQDKLDREVERIRHDEEKAKQTLDLAQSYTATMSQQIEAATQLVAELEAQQVPQVNYLDDERYQALEAKLVEQNRAIHEASEAANGGNSDEQEKADINTAITRNQRVRDSIRDDLATCATMLRHVARVRELEQHEEALNRQLTELEKQQESTREFAMRQMQMLQEKVNKLFHLIEFRMFKTLMNGNTEPTCECTLHGTPYQDLSNSEKINAGLDIIEAMCRHNDTYAPVFCDNAEAVNEVLATTSQQILLSVSLDKQLTIIK